MPTREENRYLAEKLRDLEREKEAEKSAIAEKSALAEREKLTVEKSVMSAEKSEVNVSYSPVMASVDLVDLVSATDILSRPTPALPSSDTTLSSVGAREPPNPRDADVSPRGVAHRLASADMLTGADIIDPASAPTTLHADVISRGAHRPAEISSTPAAHALQGLSASDIFVN